MLGLFIKKLVPEDSNCIAATTLFLDCRKDVQVAILVNVTTMQLSHAAL